MRLFSEEVKITSSNSPLNILQVKDFSEVFFGVFEVQINENKYVVEKISEENGNPIVSILVEDGDAKAQYPFLLLKGKQEIYFNSESEPVEIFESKIENADEQEDEVIQNIIEECSNVEIIDDKKEQIIKEINKIKREATENSLKILENNKLKKIREIKNESNKKEKALKEYLESAREKLVNEFTNISNKIRKELISDNDYKFEEIRESVDLKIQDIADNLKESLENNFENSSKLIDKSVKKLVKELYETNINPRVDKELNDIALEIVEKVSEIDKNLNNKLNKKADASLLEDVNKEIDAIRDANIELNNSLNKGVQKALSRVGNVDKKIVEISGEFEKISEEFEKKIADTEQEITQYFDEKLSLIKEETLDITDEARSYFQNLIQESRENLLTEIRKIKNEKPVEYILESKKGEPIVKDWDSIEKEWNKKIHDKFENYKTDLRKYVAVYASGGGTNATQYQDGGTINGDLIVKGTISANEYIGLPPLNYLPLSGGTVTGDVSVTGLLSANRIGFNTGAGLTAGVGQLTWNDQDGTLDLGLKGGNVTLQIGQETVARVVNKTGANLLESQYRVVRIRSTAEGGAQGQRLAIVLAQANNDPNSVDTIGLVTENITLNQEGFVTTSGLVRGINTTGSLQGETWLDGDVLYLSPTTPGVLTKVKPQAPNHTVVVGFVVYAHSNQGKIFVKVDNGYEIDELHNVRITSVSANDVLKYNGAAGVWENSNTLTLSALSADRIYTTQLDALSANITVVDIKQYELSGFNVTGNVTINGSVSSQNISAGNIFTNGLPVATPVDPVRTTLTGNGVLSSFAINGAANLINPSALIVAIDGVLQEPSVDYLVNNGTITFTSPLPNGRKAVVISPSNSLIAGQVVPSDGSVTSAKIAGGVSISEPVLTNPIINNGTLSSTINNTAFSLNNEQFVAQVNSRNASTRPVVAYFNDFDGSVAGLSVGGNGTGLLDDSSAAPLCYGIQRISTAGANGDVRSLWHRAAGGMSIIGSRFRACFAIDNTISSDIIIGLGWAASGVFGLSYRSGQDNNAFTFVRANGSTVDSGTYTTLSTQYTPQSGNFNSGKRYIVDFTCINSNNVNLVIQEADWNNNNWITVVSEIVNSPNYWSALRHSFHARVISRTAAIRSLWFDWVSFENSTFQR